MNSRLHVYAYTNMLTAEYDDDILTMNIKCSNTKCSGKQCFT